MEGNIVVAGKQQQPPESVIGQRMTRLPWNDEVEQILYSESARTHRGNSKVLPDIEESRLWHY
jgi:hypothetical protein